VHWPILLKQLARKVEDAAAALLIQAVSDHAVAFALAPGLETEFQPLSDTLGACGLTMPQTELGHVSRRHDHERHVEAALRRLDPITKTSLESPAP
jgi:hypothetical protein